MDKCLVVNLFGGPGAGKSRNRAGIFNELKEAGLNVEEVIEWCKYKVYEESKYTFTDQLYIFAKQRKWVREIADKVDIIVTDSPILLSAMYDQIEGETFRKYVKEQFLSFNNLNFFIRRKNKYNPVGRNQTEEEAKEVDTQQLRFLLSNDIPYILVDGDKNAKHKICMEIWRKLKC